MEYTNLIDELLSEALVHKVSTDGTHVGAYVYKNQDPTQGVQPVTIHKDHISNFFHKLLDELPEGFRGKQPIGVIDANYKSPEDVKDFNGNQVVSNKPEVSDQWHERKKVSSEEMELNAQKEKNSKIAAKQARSNRPITGDHIRDLMIAYSNGPDQVDDAQGAFQPLFKQHSNAFGVDKEQLKSIVGAALVAKSKGKVRGEPWEDVFARRINPKAVKAEKIKIDKNKENVKPEIGLNLPSELERLTTPGDKIGNINYVHGKKINALDLDFLKQSLDKVSNIRLDTLDQDDPKLASNLKNNLGSQWKNILYLAKSAKTHANMGADPARWQDALKDSDLLSITGLDQISNIDDIAKKVYSAAISPSPVSTPKPVETDAHYHDEDGSQFNFNSKDLNRVLSDLGTSSPHTVIHKDPKKAQELKSLFGKEWPLVLSVAQRINKHKADGHQDPVAKTKEEYGDALANRFGKDWEQSFKKIADNLDPATQLTQKDQSLDKKDKALQQLDASYSIGNQAFSPDLQYLRDVALPSVVGKPNQELSGLDVNSKLYKELADKLGPSWIDMLSVARQAQEDAIKRKDPYKEMLNTLDKDPSKVTNLQSKLGGSFLDTLSSIIQATTGIKPPVDLKNRQNTEYQAKTDTNLPAQASDETPTNNNLQTVTNTDLDAQNDGTPTNPSLPVQASDETPTNQNLKTVTHRNLPTIAPDQPEIKTTADDPQLQDFAQQYMNSLNATPQDLPAQSNQTQQNLPAQAQPAAELPQQNPVAPVEPQVQTDVNLPAQPAPDTAQTQQNLPVQPPTPPVAEIPKPQPIDGGGAVAQSAQANRDVAQDIKTQQNLPAQDGETPTRDLKTISTDQNLPAQSSDILRYNHKGVTAEIRPDQIDQLLQLNLEDSDYTNPIVRQQLEQSYGKSWLPIYTYVKDIQKDVQKGIGSSGEEFKHYYRGVLSSPRELKNIEKVFGPEWQKFLHGLIDVVVSKSNDQPVKTQENLPIAG